MATAPLATQPWRALGSEGSGGISGSALSARRNPSRRPSPLAVCLRPNQARQTPDRRDGTAERWFEDTNANVQHSNAQFTDDDPPFYMNDRPAACLSSPGVDARRPQRPALPRMDSLGESGSEDIRSVIDDLTVENQRLKRRLRKFEKLHCTHLQREKLFEVRFHKLPAHKKRQLEDTLQDFASSLDDSPAHTPKSTSASGMSPTRRPYAEAPSSGTSDSRVNDSAYASMTTATRPNEARAGPGPPSGKRQKASQVQSYLHDIPAGLLPRHSPVMTEESKKKLVVRRLEQLFTGRASEKGEHSQPLQQQEVSNSAALADRSAVEARGHKPGQEGTREARIMSDQGEGNLERPESERERQSGPNGTESMTSQASSSSISSPDQRPTRPLDLDPQRAQFPRENVEYIRHLGVTLPTPGTRRHHHPHTHTHTHAHASDSETSDTSTSIVSTPTDQGWVYLNLLTNMAQLHTINVTPDFVKSSVMDCSANLELSLDGGQIRWRGGRSSTQLSVGSESDTERTHTHHTNYDHKPCPDVHVAKKRRVLLGQTHPTDVQYKPLFFHRDGGSDDEEDYYPDDSDSLMSSKAVEDGPATQVTSQPGAGAGGGGDVNGRRSARSSTQREDGPVIFYNRAKFCTDLSGDRVPSGTKVSYVRSTAEVVGAPEKGDELETTDAAVTGVEKEAAETVEETINAYTRALITQEHQDVLQVDTDTTPLDGPSLSLDPFNAASPLYQGPLQFEASGLFGVHVQDNFAINVRSQLRTTRTPTTPVSKFSGPKAPTRRIVHRISEDKMALFRDGSTPTSTSTPTTAPPRREILSTQHIPLSPSALPPPSCLLHVSSSEDGSAGDSPAQSQSRPRPSLYSFSSSSSSGSSAYSSSSIDMLASARRIDPDTVAAREAEFEAGRAETPYLPPSSRGAVRVGGPRARSTSAAAVAGSIALEDRVVGDQGRDESGSEDGSEDESASGWSGSGVGSDVSNGTNMSE